MFYVLLDQVVLLSKVLKPVDIHANLYWPSNLYIAHKKYCTGKLYKVDKLLYKTKINSTKMQMSKYKTKYQ